MVDGRFQVPGHPFEGNPNAPVLNNPILARVPVVRVAENAAERIAAGWKPMPSERVNNPIPAGAKLFSQSDKDENERVNDGPLPNVGLESFEISWEQQD
jgi:hypothetical protein